MSKYVRGKGEEWNKGRYVTMASLIIICSSERVQHHETNVSALFHE
jgi:hypothetical protein